MASTAQYEVVHEYYVRTDGKMATDPEKTVTDGPIEFRNQNCGGWRTAAVTSWPLTVLKAGQQTEVYVVVKRQDETPTELVRKPLIPREYN